MGGKHRKSVEHKALKAAIVGTTSSALVISAGNVANAASPSSTLDAIQQCESGGNPRITGYSGKHFGLFQFDMPTWRSVGGSGNPAKASPGEQRQRAGILLDQRGTQPWNASKACWSKHVGSKTSGQSNHKESGGSVTVKLGDTLQDIAAAHGISWRELYQVNKSTVKNPNVISVGMSLRLP